MKANRLVLLAVAGAVTFALSGCSASGGEAATVGDTEITTSDVTFLTQMQCNALDLAAKDPAQAGQAQATTTRIVRAQMVNALVQAVLNGKLAEKAGVDYDRATYRQVMEQFESAVQQAKEGDRDRFRDLVGSFYQGQLEVYAIAQRELEAQGVKQPTQEQVDQLITAIQDEYRKTVDVEVNPVYGPDADGFAGAEDPSLSIPISSFAKQATSETPDAKFIGTLPAGLRCGA